MGFIDNIKENFCNLTGLEPLFKIVMLGDRALYVEGIKEIKSYSTESIEIIIPNGIMQISGEDLEISKYCLGDLAVCGKIKSLARI